MKKLTVALLCLVMITICISANEASAKIGGIKLKNGLIVDTADLSGSSGPEYMTGSYMWKDARVACQAKAPAGTWRLPNRKELYAIYLNRNTKLANTGLKTDGSTAGFYWSSTHGKDYVWDRDFYDGSEEQVDNTYTTHFIRCVRR